MITIEQIRNNLILAIQKSGLTQTEIAKRLKIKQPTVGQYLSGRALPALDTFANLCIVLDIEPAEILYNNNTNTKTEEFEYFDGIHKIKHTRR